MTLAQSSNNFPLIFALINSGLINNKFWSYEHETPLSIMTAETYGLDKLISAFYAPL